MSLRRSAADVEQVVWQALTDLAARSTSGLPDPAAARAIGTAAKLEDDIGLTSLQVLAAASDIGSRLMPADSPPVVVTDVRTVADLCRLFSEALEHADGGGALNDEGQDDEVVNSLNRAEARRRRRSGNAG